MLRLPRLPGRLAAAWLVLVSGVAAPQQGSTGAGPPRTPFTVALFSAHPPAGEAPLAVRFVDRSLGGVTSWSWDFGDGTGSSLQHPTHVYREGGSYTVRLSVDGPRGKDTLEKLQGVIVRSCTLENARLNKVTPLERGEDFVPITGDDALGFYCVYSGKAATSDGQGISNNVGLFLFPLANGEMLLFGSGYGDANSMVVPTRDAAHDVHRIDAIIRFCLGRRPETTPIRFVTPHGHIDHVNADCIRELRRRNYPIVEIAFHAADAAATKGLPGWTNADRALFRTLRSQSTQCQEELTAYASPLGKIWLHLRAGHTAGSIDLVIDVENDPTHRFVVRGSGASYGVCAIPFTREALDPHGNVRLRAPAPKVLAFAPADGSVLGGTRVVVSGQDFAAELAGAPLVTFDGVRALDVEVLDDGTLTCVAPPGVPGESVDLRVQNRNGQDVRAGGFRYRALPSVTGLVPARGVVSGGTRVTLTGSGFLVDSPGANTVHFDGLPATAVEVLDDATLACTVPAGLAGLADVTLANQNGAVELPGAFRYDPLLDVTGLGPALGSARGGLNVQINGSAFAVGTSVPQVFFGPRAATGVVRLSDTRLTCVTPPGPGGTQVDVRVSGENGSDVLASAFRYFVEPVVSALNPAEGPAAGGTPVTVTGNHFTRNYAGPNTVTFGGVAASQVVTLSDGALQCLAPAGPGGSAVEVVVSNANGTGRLAQGFRYRRTPLLTDITPDQGARAGGTLLTLRGAGFLEPGAGVTGVTFDGMPGLELAILDDATLTCRSPAGALDVRVDVAVFNANGQALLPQGFRYVSAPLLTALTPDAGPGKGGTLVTLQGGGFFAAGAGPAEVSFGGRPAQQVRVLDDGRLICRAPPAKPGTSVTVRVTNQNGAAQLAGAYRYLALPGLEALFPDRGALAGGERVTLIGSGFAGPSAPVVGFASALATDVQVLSDGRLVCITPPGVRGPVGVSLRTAAGTVLLRDGFVYGSTEPVLAALVVDHGPSQGGTPVVLHGSGFSASQAGACAVTFGGQPASDVRVPGDNRITCLAPAGPPGARVDVRVSNANGAATLAAAFRYHLQPALASLTPAGGRSAGGTQVTLRGSGFTSDAAGPPEVRFGGVLADGLELLEDATLTCVAPPGLAGSLVEVSLRNANGSARLEAAFRYLGAPTLAALTPPTGTPLGGTLVTLSGTGFSQAAAGTTTLRFGSAPATQLTLLDDGTLTCRAPPGPPGARVDVHLENANGTATLADAFGWFAAPRIDGLAPSSGPAAGGTTVVLTGSGLQDGGLGRNDVFFGGLPARSVTTVDDTRVHAEAPAGSAGASVAVSLSNANGQALAPESFRYNPAPTLASFDPSGARANGGVTVTLRGSGFSAGGAGLNSVLFGASPATSVRVLDDTTLTCTTPAGSGGSTVVVSLANANGSASAPAPFEYFAPPRIDELAPPQGFSGGGTLVELRGAGFSAHGAGPNAVWFGALLASEVTTLDDGTLRCRTPAAVLGPVSVRVENANGTDTRLDGFYYDWAPTLTGFQPGAGSSFGGAEVTLTGGGFATPGAGPLSVRFGANLATNVRVQHGGVLLCSAPAGPAGTTVQVSVSNSRGSASLSGFRYHPRPTLSSVEPPSGPPEGGTLVTLRGSGFLANGAGLPSVRFAGIAATGVVVVDDTTARCTSPAGPARTSATLTLANANGSASFVDAFRWRTRDPADLDDDGVADALLAGGDAVYLFFGDALGLADESSAAADLVLRPSLAGTDFGAQLAAGDLNGDQLADMVVAAPLDDVGGADTGAVYVFYGPLAASPSPRLSTSAQATFRGAAAGDRFGSGLALRDVSGDGKIDLVVGAPLNDAPGTDGGAVYVYRGGASFASQSTAQAAVRLLASDAAHSFGAALASGDATGDGVADLLVGAPLDDTGGPASGAAYLFRGGASLANASAGAALARLDGDGSGDRLGACVALGDFDGDGSEDLFLSAPEARSGGLQGGLLYYIRGGAGLGSGSVDDADAILEPEASGDRLGQALATADVDGDGRFELLVGAPQHDLPAANAGRAYLLGGGTLADGTIAHQAHMILVAENASGDQFGTSLAWSDLDADGHVDLLIGAPFSNGGGADSGRAYVFSGALLQATRSAVADDVTFTGASAALKLGREISGPR